MTQSEGFRKRVDLTKGLRTRGIVRFLRESRPVIYETWSVGIGENLTDACIHRREVDSPAGRFRSFRGVKETLLIMEKEGTAGFPEKGVNE